MDCWPKNKVQTTEHTRSRQLYTQNRMVDVHLNMTLKNSLFLVFLLVHSVLMAQNDCRIRNEAFKTGETLRYKVLYNWGALWLSAGEVEFRVDKGEYNGKLCHHLVGQGGTYEKYNWFYKVDDLFEALVDTASLKPYRFTRISNEGNTYIYSDCYFNPKKNKVYTLTRRKRVQALKADSVSITPCTFDVLTAIYQSRCIDFSRYKVYDTIPISLFLDDKVYPVYIRYIGKEVLKTEEFGSFHCIKFKPLLIEGTIFEAGENMTVWVTDDKNRVPLYVETPILVGSIKVRLIRYSQLRSPLTSKTHSGEE